MAASDQAPSRPLKRPICFVAIASLQRTVKYAFARRFFARLASGSFEQPAKDRDSSERESVQSSDPSLDDWNALNVCDAGNQLE